MGSAIMDRSAGLWWRTTVLAVVLLLPAYAERAPAAEIALFDGVDTRWDNTFLYSAAVRVTPADPVLVSNPNADDGDRNFVPGLVSNRLDVRSVFTLSRGDFGLEASIEAWFDTVYHQRTANNSPATYNAISVSNTEFPKETRNLEGQYIDLADTFVYGNVTLGDTPVTIRAGRQTLLWGESLFFNENSIASAQAPVDYWKTAALPFGYSHDVYLPVGEVSLQAQPQPDLSIAAYYQFEWRESRLAGVGSYFSTTDVLGEGAERLIRSPGNFFLHGVDSHPRNGQFGVSLHKTLGDVDLGFYALSFDAKYPVLVVLPAVKKFNSTYPKHIALYGISFSSYVGDSNVTGELSAKRNAPLSPYASSLSYPGSSLPLGGGGYARGNTLHGQVSSATTLPPSAAWDSANLDLEVAADYTLGMTKNSMVANLPAERFSPSVRALLEPHYFEVMPGLDLTLPVGFGYNDLGQYGDSYTSRPGGSDFEAGVEATYRSVWKASLAVTYFLGSPASQPLADRSFISFSLERTF